MNIDVRIKAVTLFLGVAYLVTPYRAILHADTRIGSGSLTNSFFGSHAVILTEDDNNNRRLSEHDHGQDHGGDHGQPGGDHGGNNGHGGDHSGSGDGGAGAGHPGNDGRPDRE
jgi:hypothetical protein